MTCNGYGHPPDCNCGWGGEYHGGEGFLLRDYEETHWQKSDSWSNPNARCPECGVKVFFYRSPDGGAVFFDEPGYPWPKHPCTDQKQCNTALPLPKEGTPKEPGWFPLLYDSAWRTPDKVGVLLNVNETHGLLVKVKFPMFYGHPPVMVKLVDRNIGEYDLRMLRFHDGVYQAFQTKAWKLQALREPRVARLFPNTVNSLNRSAVERFRQ